MATVAWIVTLPGVLVALACGVPPALLTPRFARARGPVLATLAAAVAGAFTGAVWLGRGPLTSRLAAGAVARLRLPPWAPLLRLLPWGPAPGGASPSPPR